MIRRADPLSRLFWFRYRFPSGSVWGVMKFRSEDAAREEQRRCITYGWDCEAIRVPKDSND